METIDKVCDGLMMSCGVEGAGSGRGRRRQVCYFLSARQRSSVWLHDCNQPFDWIATNTGVCNS